MFPLLHYRCTTVCIEIKIDLGCKFLDNENVIGTIVIRFIEYFNNIAMLNTSYALIGIKYECKYFSKNRDLDCLQSTNVISNNLKQL